MDEFGALTPGMFAALCKQRVAEFKRQVWLQNLVVAAVFNAQRTDPNQHYFEAWDFMPDPSRDEEREQIIKILRSVIFDGYTVWTKEKIEKFREEWTKKLTEKGRSDVTLIMERVLKETETKEK